MRTIFKIVYEKNRGLKGNILLTKPKDIDYEIYIFEKYQALMKHILQEKEKRTTLEQDLASVSDPDLKYTLRFATIYRLEKKKILRSNIDLAGYVLVILRALKEDPGQNLK